MEQRSKVLAEEKTTEVKKYWNQMQSTRVAEQQERKHWTKRHRLSTVVVTQRMTSLEKTQTL